MIDGMIYDSYSVAGNCKGCGCKTYWHINGDYPACKYCISGMIMDISKMDLGEGVSIEVEIEEAE